MSSDFIDPLNPPFRTLLLKRIANDGRLPYQVKCMSLFAFPYVLGSLVTLASGTFYKYILDYGFLTLSLTAAVSFLTLVHACKQINPTLCSLDKTINHTGDREFQKFCTGAKNECGWTDQPLGEEARKLSPFGWYVFYVAIPVSFLLSLGATGIIGPNWVRDEIGVSMSWYVNFIFYLSWLALMGYIIGVAVNRLGYYAFLVNQYCHTFILNGKKKLDFCNPIKIDGLKPIGRLALKINLGISLPPTVALVVILAKQFSERQMTLLSSPFHVLMLVAYSSVLVFVFFFPIRHLHKAMKAAKKNALQIVEKRFEKLTGRISEIGGLLVVSEHTKRCPTWPFDLGLFLKVLGTVLFPLIAGAFLQVALERLIP